jgi:hypothetical protein
MSKIAGDLEFDNHCVFASNVDLTDRHVADLAIVAKLKPTNPHYIYEMKKSHVLPRKAKMIIWLTLLIFLYTLICNQQLLYSSTLVIFS